MTQAISDFPPLKRSSPPHPLEADEDNRASDQPPASKGEICSLVFYPTGFPLQNFTGRIKSASD